MVELADNFEFRIELCQICKKSSMKEVARVDSFFFKYTIYCLLRCENRFCNAHVWSCVICKDEEIFPYKIYFIKEGIASPFELLRNYIPPEATTPYVCSARLPDGLIQDFDQAFNCFESGFFDASAAMARRTMETALIGKGAQAHIELVDMILQLSKEGKIPTETKFLCEDLRRFGNKGAHSGKSVDKSRAEVCIEFADIIVSWLYGDVQPMNKSKSEQSN